MMMVPSIKHRSDRPGNRFGYVIGTNGSGSAENTRSKIVVYSSDTDFTPFDVGAYASSTTYISGMAVKKCAEKIKEQVRKEPP
jgi:hypothetical protein